MSRSSTLSRAVCWSLYCETKARWSSAMRAALTASNRADCAGRVFSADEDRPPERLMTSTAPVVLGLEVTPANLDERMADFDHWRRQGMIFPVGLISSNAFPAGEPARVAAMLSEAGAAATVDSPLRVDQLIDLSDRHAAVAWDRLSATLAPHELVWRRLPWQSPPWAIG